ncbi:hypothetical protein, partial [Salmonella enterica]|uniref:hypothetical protein n=1 Tax=Salmonella enterica TaxID=28901 RepID=UPI002FCDAE28
VTYDEHNTLRIHHYHVATAAEQVRLMCARILIEIVLYIALSLPALWHLRTLTYPCCLTQ